MTTSKWCRDKQAVVVVVYAEKPRGRGGGGRRHEQRRLRVRGNNINVNRRGELLEYARHLREPSIPPASHHHINQPISTTQVFGGDGGRKQKHASRRRLPTCFDKWSCFAVTRFLRSTKDDDDKKKMNRKKKAEMKKALVKPPTVQKKESFISKLLAALQKRRCKN